MGADELHGTWWEGKERCTLDRTFGSLASVEEVNASIVRKKQPNHWFKQMTGVYG